MPDYIEQMQGLYADIIHGMEHYATELDDLDGDVLSPIYDMRQLTEQQETLPNGVDKQDILDLLDEAEQGALDYAENLYDTTDCTYPIDKMADLLELEWE